MTISSQPAIASTSAILAEIERVLDLEDVPAALDLLAKLDNERLNRKQRLGRNLLAAHAYLISRQLALLDSVLTEARSIVRRDETCHELDLLAANGKVLAGEAVEALRTVLPILRSSDRASVIHARASHIAGLCLYRRGHYSWAKELTERGIAYYRLRGNKPRVAGLLINLALIEKSRGRPEAALLYLDEAAGYLPPVNYAKTRLRLLVNRGVVLIKLGDLAPARTCLLDAKNFLDDRLERFYASNVSTNLGHVFRMEGNFTTAIEFYEASLGFAVKEASARQECVALEFLGETYTEAGEFAKAERYLQKALELAKAIAPQGDVMMEVLRRLGELHARTGKTESARKQLDKALELCRSRGEKRELVLTQRAILSLEQDRNSAWLERVRHVFAMLLQMNDRFEHMRTVLEIAETRDPAACNSPWFEEALVAATYYLDCHGPSFWKKRFQGVLGHSRRLSVPGKSGARTTPPITSSKSRAFLKTLESVRFAARTLHPILLVGETGVGKEVVTRVAHSWSDRCAGPLVAINCGALPRDLVESELFGHAKGTFTGATTDKVGLLEAGARGTVLLDEIGDLPLETQTKLLRFLDSGELRRVGETRSRTSGARIIAATNTDLYGLVEAGQFRADLLHRLNVFHIVIPALRERREDILDLARLFLTEEAAGGIPPGLSSEVQEWMLEYRWPGNVRELRNLCRYLAARAWGRPYVRIEDLPPTLPRIGDPARVQDSPDRDVFSLQREAFEKQQIVDALRRTQGTIRDAARLLGVGRNTLSNRIRAFGIDTAPFKERR